MKSRIGKPAILGLLITIIMLCITSLAQAENLGVGIYPGTISLDEPLHTGSSDDLPSVSVMNTGDIEGYYEMEVVYFHDQEEHSPPAEWFKFSPGEPFKLKPGQSQKVAVTLEIPEEADTGDYYAGIEAHPIALEGGVSIGIGAAVKLYFTVKEKDPGFFEANAVLFYVLLGVVGLIVVIFLFMRIARIRIKLG